MVAASASSGRNGGRSACRPGRAHSASSRPTAPPSAPSTVLSTSSCRTRRPRLAPSDRRMAISCRRAAARASSRLATLAHAMSSTRPTITMSSPPALTKFWRKAGLMVAWASGTSVTLRPRLSFGYSCARAAAIAFMLAFGLRQRHPGFQPPGHLEQQRPARFPVVAHEPAGRLAVHRERHPQLRPADGIGAAERLRRDADDDEGAAVEGERLSNDGRITAEAALPQAMSEHGHGGGPGSRLLVGQEPAPGGHRRAEQVEVAG